MSLHTTHKTVVVTPVLCRPPGPSPSLAGAGFGREDVDWKETKTRITVSVSKELNVFANHQHHRGRSKSGTKRSTPASPNSHHHPSLYKKVPTYSIDDPKDNTTPSTPLPHPNQQRKNIPAAPRAQPQPQLTQANPPWPEKTPQKKGQVGKPSPFQPNLHPQKNPEPSDRSRITTAALGPGTNLAGAGPAIGIRGRVGRTRDPGASRSRPTLA